MTIEEAIQHCYDVANKVCDECAEEHLQLAKWLEELKRHRQFRVNKDIKNPLANLSGYVCHHCDHKDEYIIEYEDTGLTPKQIEQMKQENADLKRLLKLAVEHMRILADSIRSQADECSCCGLCAYDGDFAVGESGDYLSECPGFESNECFVWEHAEEALKLIGGQSE
ncbi:MAG: hypothetical protein ACI4JQ_06410 [Ruminococcus sp.]